IITHYAKLRNISITKFDYFLIKKALFSRLLLIPMFIKLSKTRVSIRLRDTLERIVNDGGGGIICIIL
ncbi:sporulation stage IV protein A, partial [Thermoanaerobacterium thermosaccharolyticum]|uniref:sporulation stage IV protein A n=1 Tax=Thermoanaerobacterium thermosaccharolyticum TaxID=1517 RepID=UPI002FD9C5D5